MQLWHQCPAHMPSTRPGSQLGLGRQFAYLQWPLNLKQVSAWGVNALRANINQSWVDIDGQMLPPPCPLWGLFPKCSAFSWRVTVVVSPGVGAVITCHFLSLPLAHHTFFDHSPNTVLVSKSLLQTLLLKTRNISVFRFLNSVKWTCNTCAVAVCSRWLLVCFGRCFLLFFLWR